MITDGRVEEGGRRRSVRKRRRRRPQHLQWPPTSWSMSPRHKRSVQLNKTWMTATKAVVTHARINPLGHVAPRGLRGASRTFDDLPEAYPDDGGLDGAPDCAIQPTRRRARTVHLPPGAAYRLPKHHFYPRVDDQPHDRPYSPLLPNHSRD